ncbi:MAG: hypothetical protein U9Q66_04255 [Patescibacteria group bacterium]|nr:hypothetical protein [Patescibacteria group bacterium]
MLLEILSSTYNSLLIKFHTNGKCGESKVEKLVVSNFTALFHIINLFQNAIYTQNNVELIPALKEFTILLTASVHSSSIGIIDHVNITGFLSHFII